MFDTAFSFEIPQWERAIEALPMGSTLSASAFLSMTEPESEEGLEEAFSLLEERGIALDVSDLPRLQGAGSTAVRLKLEADLVANHRLPDGLEETDPLRLYLQEVASLPCCGDVEVLAHAHLEGDESAAPRLMNAMLSCVVEEACNRVGQGVLLMDLIQEGSLGLWQAILDYDGSGDVRSHCLRAVGAMMAKVMVLHAREFGIGQRLRQAMEDYRSVDERLLSDLGRNPTVEEIAIELHMPLAEAMAVRDMIATVRSLGQSVPDEETQIPEEEDQAVEDTAYFQMRQRISELLSLVSEQEAKLLTLRFGLEGALPLTPEQTAARLGMEPEQVLAMEAGALAKMRGKL